MPVFYNLENTKLSASDAAHLNLYISDTGQTLDLDNFLTFVLYFMLLFGNPRLRSRDCWRLVHTWQPLFELRTYSRSQVDSQKLL